MGIITLCGSTKYSREIEDLYYSLEDRNHIVHLPELYMMDNPGLYEMDSYYIQKGLLLGHFKKIEMSDLVIICNFYGYSGVSTTLELGYAKAFNKQIIAIHEDTELAKSVLYDSYILSKYDKNSDMDYKSITPFIRSKIIEKINKFK